MAGTISFDGLATGIKTQETVDKLIQVEGRPKLLREAEKQRLENQRSAWQDMNTKLLDLRTKAQELTKSSSWATISSKASDESVLKATATSSALEGSYTFEVVQLAQKHMVASGGYASALATVGQGTLTIGSGTKSKEITIDASNNTLAGVAQAINEAKVGVTATVINDGTGATGYKLLLSSNETGEENELTTQIGAGLTIAFPTEVQAAQNAEIKFGSGAGAISIYSASNTVNGVVEGVTLNLLSEKPGSKVTLTLSRDASALEKSMQAFVDAYNTSMGAIKAHFVFNDKTKTGGILMGDRTLVGIQNRLQGLITGTVATDSSYRSMRSIGISMKDDGSLSFDASKFQKAIADDPTAVQRLFRTTGRTDNAKTSFVYAGFKTAESSAAGYAVDVTAVATRATLVAGQALTLPVDIDGTNDTLNLLLDRGSSFEVKLTHGAYETAEELATELQSKINAAGGASQVTVGVDGDGKLAVTSVLYGSASKVRLVDGNALASLGFAAAQEASGTDVAGTLNGEPATGTGQVLKGKAGNAKTEGLEVKIELEQADLIAGAEANVFVAKGLASRFNEYLQDLTEPLIGRIDQRTSALDTSIEDIDARIKDMQKRLDQKRESLMEMFQRMEKAVSELNSQGNYLINALAGLNKN